uniref:Origin recognition complex subunit 1 n=1 Tax=Panagrolaimus sp. PS1159 TaxID=55785 RepID=A0AC35ERZ1_9BILA
MSPTKRSPRKAFIKANNAITTPKKKQNIAAVKAAASTTPLPIKFGNLSLKSPATRKGSPTSGSSDKENVQTSVSSKKKKCNSKKRLPLGELNGDEDLFTPRTNISTSQPTTSLLPTDENMDIKNTSNKSKTTPKKTPKASAKPVSFEENSEPPTWTIELKTPLKLTLRRSPLRSTTPQRNSQPYHINKLEKESQDETVKYNRGLEEEWDSGDDILKRNYNGLEDEDAAGALNDKRRNYGLEDEYNSEEDAVFKNQNYNGLEVEYESEKDTVKPAHGLEDEYDSGNDDDGKDSLYGLEPEYEESDCSDESSVLFGSRNTVPKYTKETFEDEPDTAEIELLLNTISKLELDVMQEDAKEQADRRQKRDKNPLMKIYPFFHTSAVPDILLKRDEESKEIETFIKNSISPSSSAHNRTIYISGVPGTGKTACVTKVIQKLQLQKKPVFKFTYVYVNGLELVKPQHVFTEIYKGICPSVRPPASKSAREKLSKIFTFDDPKRKPIVLVIDELDMLCTKSQDVVYDIFDWASTSEARLSVIAIANTLDLPERVLKQRVSSRMGYKRLTFQPYNFEEIKHILEHRIKKFKISFKGDAFGLISRKVAAVSGDVRKALEFIRRAIEIAVDNDDEILTMNHATAAIKESLQPLPTLFTKSLSKHQEFLLRSIIQEIRATTLEELDFFLIYDCYRRICVSLSIDPMEMCSITGLLTSLQNMGYIEIKSNGLISRRVILKTSVDEIEYLLKQMKVTEEI